MKHEISITRNDAGEIIGWTEGVTFNVNDHPYRHKMRRYVASLWHADPETGACELGETEFVEITAIDDETAIAILDHHYNIPPRAILEELRTTRRDVPLPQLAE